MPGVESDPTSTKNTAETRRSVAPDRSSATTVSSKVGGPGRAVIAAMSATYMQRGDALVHTICGAVIGATDADQIRHTSWRTTLAELFAIARGR